MTVLINNTSVILKLIEYLKTKITMLYHYRQYTISNRQNNIDQKWKKRMDSDKSRD